MIDTYLSPSSETNSGAESDCLWDAGTALTGETDCTLMLSGSDGEPLVRFSITFCKFALRRFS